MSFGGFFGGGGSPGKDSASASSSSLQNDAPNSTFPSGTPTPSSFGGSSESSAIKSRLISAIATQSNIANAKQLISQVNSTCFDHCVPSPGSSLSSREQQCLSACMEKYIEGWNAVSKTYIGRLQREGVNMSMSAGGGAAAATAPQGKELF